MILKIYMRSILAAFITLACLPASASESTQQLARGKATDSQAQKNPPSKLKSPLALDQIKRMLKVEGADSAVAAAIRNRGINFTSTHEIIDNLKTELGDQMGPKTLSVLKELVSNRVPYVTLSAGLQEAIHDQQVILFANAIDPDHDKLEYYWATTAGTIEETGQVAKLNTVDIVMNASPLEVTITVTVIDRKGGSSSDSKLIYVRVPQLETSQTLSMKTQRDGKYVLVSLEWKYGKTASTSGAIKIELDNSTDMKSVSGRLPGRPCTVNYEIIENVAEFSFKERPSQLNNWEIAVVRLRPENPKRAVRFSINWRTLYSSSGQ